MFKISLVVVIWLCLTGINAWLSYRIGRLLGHWEYGFLTFWVIGYLQTIAAKK